MPTVTTTDGTSIYYRDWGTGQPIVFSHGWPLTAAAWEAQMLFFNAQAILERVKAGTMPCDGAWPSNWVEVFERWTQSGMSK